MKIISLKKIAELLGYSDIRSVKKWCKKNGVFILHQGKNEFVAESNFKEAFDKPLIKELQKKYGKNWQDVYQSYNEGKIPELPGIGPDHSVSGSKFKPNHEIISNYLNKYEKSKAA